MTLDPIHQFNINNLFTIGHIGGQTIYFTNSSAYMLVTVAVICLLACSSCSLAGQTASSFPISSRVRSAPIYSAPRANLALE